MKGVQESSEFAARPFFIAALLLAIAALLTQGIGRSYMTDLMHRQAVGLEQSFKDHKPYHPDAISLQLRLRWNIFLAVGAAMTLLSVISAVIAKVRAEPGWYLMLIMVMLVSVMIPLLL